MKREPRSRLGWLGSVALLGALAGLSGCGAEGGGRYEVQSSPAAPVAGLSQQDYAREMQQKAASAASQPMVMMSPGASASGGVAGGVSAPARNALAQAPALASGSPGGSYALTHSSPAPVEPKATLNPNFYIANNYVGGSGARDRMDKLVREGVLLDGKRIRLEAFSRRYAQSFPIPTGSGLGISAETERARMVEQGGRTFLQVGLQAASGEAPRRPRLNIALVVDCSGSMQEERKMEFARAAAAKMVEALRPDDYLSLVAFDGVARVVLAARPAGDRREALNQIINLAPGSATNIHEGLQRGYEQVRRFASPENANLVILLSDGEITAGVNDPDVFHQMATKNADLDIQTSTVGMGVDFNEELMLALARDGRGNYHFLRDGKDTEAVLRGELDQLTHTVARAVKVRIRLADGVGLVRVLGTRQLNSGETKEVKAEEKQIDRRAYEELGITTNRQREREEPGIKMMIPNFQRGDNHVVMLEIQVPPGRGKRDVAQVFLKYKDVATRANREVNATARLEYTPDRQAMIASTRRAVKKNLLGFQTGEALMQAATLIQQGQAAAAAKALDERMVVLGLAAREWRDSDLDSDGRLLGQYRDVVSRLHTHPQMASNSFGEYVAKSLTFGGYQRTQ